MNDYQYSAIVNQSDLITRLTIMLFIILETDDLEYKRILNSYKLSTTLKTLNKISGNLVDEWLNIPTVD